jgi:multiple sugar transport system substrate-binding protein
MKKTLTVLVLVVLTIAFLGASGKTEKTDGKTTLTFGFWGDTPEANMKMELAKAYMEKNPNVNIEFEYTDGGGYLTKMQTWFSSNTAPDVFGVASDVVANFLENPTFEDLRGYIEKDNLGDIWSWQTIDSMYTSRSGKVIAVPFISKTFVMLYNKSLFDAAGLAYPTDNWTVDDMIAAARVLTKGEGINKTYGLRWGVRPAEFYRNLYGNPVYDTTTNKINAANNEEFKAAVALFVDTIKEGLAPDETGGAISTGGFETGRFGMQLSATWDIAPLMQLSDSFEWDAVMLPVNTQFNQRMLTTFRGNGWSINANSKHKDIAWDFIKFMSAEEAGQKIAQDFGIPELISYANSPGYLEDYGANNVVYDKTKFVKMVDYATNFNNMGVYAQINDVINEQYGLVLAGKTTIEQMVREVQVQGEKLFANF